MGIGDNLMASGMARGAAARGKRIAFGNGLKILWDQHSEIIFRGNPNVAAPGTERAIPVEWIPFYKGHRIYNRSDAGRWVWNYDFKAIAGEVFLAAHERKFAESIGQGYVVIEPNVPAFKTVAPNKQWPVARYELAAKKLRASGFDIVQMVNPGTSTRLSSARSVSTPDFRRALAVLARAALYVGPEGGLHHGAAAVGIPAVVLFGGFVPPEVTGYDTHTNLTGGSEACGSLTACEHCRKAMETISVAEVAAAARRHLRKANT